MQFGEPNVTNGILISGGRSTVNGHCLGQIPRDGHWPTGDRQNDHDFSHILISGSQGVSGNLITPRGR